MNFYALFFSFFQNFNLPSTCFLSYRYRGNSMPDVSFKPPLSTFTLRFCCVCKDNGHALKFNDALQCSHLHTQRYAQFVLCFMLYFSKSNALTVSASATATATTQK